MKKKYEPFWEEGMSLLQQRKKVEDLFELLRMENIATKDLKYIFIPNPPTRDLEFELKAYEVNIFKWGNRGEGIWLNDNKEKKIIAELMFNLKSDKLFVFSMAQQSLSSEKTKSWVEGFFDHQVSSILYKKLIFDWGDLMVA